MKEIKLEEGISVKYKIGFIAVFLAFLLLLFGKDTPLATVEASHLNKEHTHIVKDIQVLSIPEKSKNTSLSFNYAEGNNGVITLYKIIGMKGKFGFVNVPLIVNKKSDLEWLLWDKENAFEGKTLKIIAVNLTTGDQIKATSQITKRDKPIIHLSKKIETQSLSSSDQSNLYKISNKVETSSTELLFPKQGEWELQLYINGNYFNQMLVNVYKSKKQFRLFD